MTRQQRDKQMKQDGTGYYIVAFLADGDRKFFNNKGSLSDTRHNVAIFSYSDASDNVVRMNGRTHLWKTKAGGCDVEFFDFFNFKTRKR